MSRLIAPFPSGGADRAGLTDTEDASSGSPVHGDRAGASSRSQLPLALPRGDGATRGRSRWPGGIPRPGGLGGVAPPAKPGASPGPAVCPSGAGRPGWYRLAGSGPSSCRSFGRRRRRAGRSGRLSILEHARGAVEQGVPSAHRGRSGAGFPGWSALLSWG
jgi:hypothetical protein